MGYADAPRWLTDLRQSDHRHGFYQSDRTFGVHYTDRDSDTLIVSFDSRIVVNNVSLDRDAWGYGFYKSEGWSHLGIMCFEITWYRDDRLIDYLENLQKQGFFDQFKTVVFTGASMGGYGATAFSAIVPGSTILAFSPQTTLDRSKVPWDTRFNIGSQQDWSGRYNDSADTVGHSSNVYIVYDPAFAVDRMHAERFNGNICFLKTIPVGHGTVVHFHDIGILKAITRTAVAGVLDESLYARLYDQLNSVPPLRNL